MTFLLDGLREAWDLLISGDPELMHLLWVTLQVAGVATAAALVIGLPIGLWLGLARFRGRGALIALANAGMGLPPVFVGLVLALLMFPASALGRFHLIYTLKAVYIAQSILALPLMVALTCAAVQALPGGLLDQSRAFHARGWQRAVLAAREAWTGIAAALIAAAGTAMSEVGAIILVGGNIQGYDQTLASAALFEINAGHWTQGAAIGILLFGLILIVGALLTLLQHGPALARRWRR
ncbi:ABC transporter permease [Nocardioides sp.]|uniref:ABC transporter permease n=1 Tax=Nocardioides sp. TaxID=35761 RepID=UPI002610D758|nr:ABC transporter permease [Nocardioides sp.]